MFGTPALHAQTLQWDVDPAAGAQGGAGVWDRVANNWWNGAANGPWCDGTTAEFGGVGGIVTLTGADLTALSLHIASPGYRFQGTALTLLNGGITANADVTFENQLIGAAGVTFRGAGTVTVKTSAGLTGPVNVEPGAAVRLAAANAACGNMDVSGRLVLGVESALASGAAVAVHAGPSGHGIIEYAANQGYTGSVTIDTGAVVALSGLGAGVPARGAGLTLAPGAIVSVANNSQITVDQAIANLGSAGDLWFAFGNGDGAQGLRPQARIRVGKTAAPFKGILDAGLNRSFSAQYIQPSLSADVMDDFSLGGRMYLTATGSSRFTADQPAVAAVDHATLLGSTFSANVKVDIAAGRGLELLGSHLIPQLHNDGSLMIGQVGPGAVSGTARIGALSGSGSVTLGESSSMEFGDARDTQFAGSVVGHPTRSLTLVKGGAGTFTLGNGGSMDVRSLLVQDGTFVLENSRSLKTRAGIEVLGSMVIQSSGMEDQAAPSLGPWIAVSGTAIGNARHAFGSSELQVKGRVELNHADAALGTIRILPRDLVAGTGGTVCLNDSQAATGTIEVEAGTLTLNATRSTTGAIRITGSSVHINYNRSDAANGQQTFLLPASPTAPSPEVARGGVAIAPSTLAIGSAVTSVGNDRFHIGSGSVLVLQSATPGLLERGRNLTLDPDAIVAVPADGIISQLMPTLGTRNDLFFGVTGGSGVTDPVRVGTTDGTTPWKGITSDRAVIESTNYKPRSYATYSGAITAAGDFVLQDVWIAAPSIQNEAAGNPTASVRGLVWMQLPVQTPQMGIPVRVESSSQLLLYSNSSQSILQQLTVDGGTVQAGVPKVAGSTAVRLHELLGHGEIDVESGLTVNQGRFEGRIRMDSRLAKWSSGELRLGGTVSELPASQSIGLDVMEGSVVLLNDEALRLTDIQVAEGARIELGPFDQTMAPRGGGTIHLAGGTLTLSQREERRFDGSITGTGRVVIGRGSTILSGISSFAGEMVVGGPTRDPAGETVETRNGQLTLHSGTQLPNVTRFSLAAMGQLRLDLAGGSGGGQADPVLFSATPVHLDGGTLRVDGPPAAAQTVQFGQLVPRSGASVVCSNAGSGGTLSLQFGATTDVLGLGTRAIGATVDFTGQNLGTRNQILLKNQGAGFMGAWALANENDFAKYDSVAGVVPFGPGDYVNTVTPDRHVRLTNSPAVVGNLALRTLTVDTTAGVITFDQSPYSTLDLTDGGVLKTGAFPATIRTSAGASSKLTSSSGELVFHVNAGDGLHGNDDLTVATQITGAISLTKSGPGRMVLTGDHESANTFTGNTFVNAGTLLLNKPIAPSSGVPAPSSRANATIPGGNIFIRGGILQSGNHEQIGDTASIQLAAGGFHLDRFNETIASLTNTGGTFDSGSGTLRLNNLDLSGGVNILSGTVILTATGTGGTLGGGGQDTRTIWRITNGLNSIPARSTTEVTGGVLFSGSANPVLSINSDSIQPGVLHLKAAATVTFNGTGTAALTNGLAGALPGRIDLGGVAAREFIVSGGAALEVSAQLGNGGILKSGDGTLRLSQNNQVVAAGAVPLAQAVNIAAGTIELAHPAALGAADVLLNGGHLSMRFKNRVGTMTGSDRVWTLPNLIVASARPAGTGGGTADLAAAIIAVDEVEPDLDRVNQAGRVVLSNTLRLTSPVAGDTMNVSVVGRNGVQLSLKNLDLALPAGKATVNVQAPVTIEGDLSGTATDLRLTGTGTLRLKGSLPADNPYLGNWHLQEPLTVEMERKDSTGEPHVAINAADRAVRLSAGTLRWLANDQVAPSAVLQMDGTLAPLLDLNGFNQTVRNLEISGNGRIRTAGGRLKITAGLQIADSTFSTRQLQDQSAGGAAASATTAVLITRNLMLTGQARLDIGENGLVLDYDPGQKQESNERIRQWIAAAYASGTWSGPTGIYSSLLVGTRTGAAVGWMDSSRLRPGTRFMGETVDADAVLVRYTLAGDCNLDGKVDFTDLAAVAQNYNSPGEWFSGDFNYDGIVTFADLAAVAQHYNETMASGLAVPGASARFASDLSRALASVPEPGAASLVIAMGVIALGTTSRKPPGRRR